MILSKKNCKHLFFKMEKTDIEYLENGGNVLVTHFECKFCKRKGKSITTELPIIWESEE